MAEVSGAGTPEELETLLEDALLLRDAHALRRLVEEGALLLVGGEPPAKNREELVQLAFATWHDENPYVADPQFIGQVGNVALIVAQASVGVAHRCDGAWRYAIIRLHHTEPRRKG